MPINDEPDLYQTYVLRLWRARCEGQWQWRGSIESPHSGERQVFAGLQQLLAFLSERCDSLTPGTPERPDGWAGKGGCLPGPGNQCLPE